MLKPGPRRHGFLFFAFSLRDELACIRDTQAAYLLLRYSLAVRVHYLLRLVGDALAQHE